MENKTKVHEGVFSPDSARKMTKFLDGWAQSLIDRLNRNGSLPSALSGKLADPEFKKAVDRLSGDAARIDKMTDHDAMVSANRNIQAMTTYFNAVIKFQKDERELANQNKTATIMSDVNFEDMCIRSKADKSRQSAHQ